MENKTFVIILATSMVVLLTVFLNGGLNFFYQTPMTDWNGQELKKIDETQNNSFIVFGDNRDSGKAFDTLINRVNKENVAFAVANGDLVSAGDQDKFIDFLNQVNNNSKPILTVIGNHELKDDSEANYQKIFGPSYYSFSDNSSYYIMLDDSHGKSVDVQQMAWLEAELQKSQKYQHRFIFLHIPLFDPRGNGSQEGHSLQDLDNAHKLESLFDQYNVTMIFASHIHGYYQGYWGKTPYIITGGAGAPLEYPDPQHNFFHYIKTTVSGANVTYEVVKI